MELVKKGLNQQKMAGDFGNQEPLNIKPIYIFVNRP
jgi:hypothetical protein